MSLQNAIQKLMWSRLADPPTGISCQPWTINNTEHIAYYNENNYEKGIHKYDIQSNKYELLHKLINVKYGGYTVAFNKHSNTIYSLIYGDRKTQLQIIDIKTNKSKIINNLDIEIQYGAHGIIINNKFNVVGGNINDHNLVWNDNDNKFIKSFNFNESIGQYPVSVELKIKNEIILFGANYSVWKYVINKQKWIKTNISSRNEWLSNSFCGCVSARFDKYIIIFGGEEDDDMFSINPIYVDDIYILDINEEKWYKSILKCPEKARYKAIKIDLENKQDRLLVNGYIGKITTKYIPNDIRDILYKYYKCYREQIYLMSMNENKHWTINVDDILNCTFPCEVDSVDNNN
eukprot:424260_1